LLVGAPGEIENSQMNKEVCVLSTGNVFGGAEIFQIKLAALLRSHVHFIAVSPLLPALKRGLTECGAEFVALPAHGWLRLRWALLRWLWRHRRAISKRGVVVVLSGRGSAYFAPIVRLLTKRSPVIISQTALSMKPGDLKEWLYGVTGRFAFCVVAVSDSVAVQHRERWPGFAVQSIPNWIERSPDRTILSSKAGAGVSDPLWVAVVSRLAPQKGLEDVIEVCREIGGIELDIYGDGPIRDQMHDAGGGAAWLRIHGHVDNISQRLQNSSILLSGSYSESFSFSVAEGIQSGLLCVVTDIPAHRELLGDDYPRTLFFPPGDQVALRRSLQAARRLLCDGSGEGARRAIAGARNRILHRNSPDAARERYLAVFSAAGGEDAGV
jgi:glycosyltransferase involved in cell wall biosynthesis